MERESKSGRMKQIKPSNVYLFIFFSSRRNAIDAILESDEGLRKVGIKREQGRDWIGKGDKRKIASIYAMYS